MWENVVKRDRAQTTIRRMRIACWVRNATNALSGYATPLHQWLPKHASILRYTHIACLVSDLVK